MDLYQERLAIASEEMRNDVKMIVEIDPEAIIIIAGDHGPALTKNCFTSTSGVYDISEIDRLDIQDRYGTLLAIRWPNQDFEEFDDITVLQDLFPAIFAYMYQDVGFLDSRIEPLTLEAELVSGATVKDGIINGGINDNEELFLFGE